MRPCRRTSDHGHDKCTDDHDHDHDHDDDGSKHDHDKEDSHDHHHDHKEPGKAGGDDDDIPAWKKRALESGDSDPMAAPFGGSWNVESSANATKDDPMEE